VSRKLAIFAGKLACLINCACAKIIMIDNFAPAHFVTAQFHLNNLHLHNLYLYNLHLHNLYLYNLYVYNLILRQFFVLLDPKQVPKQVSITTKLNSAKIN